VRRIIETATRHLALAFRPPVVEVVLMGGEMPDAGWRDRFAARMSPVRVTYSINPVLGYFSEQIGAISGRAGMAALKQQVRDHLTDVLKGVGPANAVVWAHNQGLGRNLTVRAESGECG
jgi:hypothetical protein